MAANQSAQRALAVLEYLAETIQWRLKLRDQEENPWNKDNPFYWRFALQGRDVPPDTEEHAAGFLPNGFVIIGRRAGGCAVDVVARIGSDCRRGLDRVSGNLVHDQKLSAVPFKHHAAHRHHIPKSRHRITN